MNEIHTQSSFMDNFVILNVVLMLFSLFVAIYIPLMLYKIYKVLKEIKQKLERG